MKKVIKIMVTITIFTFMFMFWPRDLKSEMIVEPYFRDIDIWLLWVLALAWSVIAFCAWLKER